MSDFSIESRRTRGQNLLIVEGNHEKNELFWLIFKCFPEISISMNDVWIYGTNIYMLYEDIVNEYGADWAEVDIDLPFVISKKKNFSTLRYKEDFINIILIFDYERHDTNFSEQKIVEMQNYFVDAADSGKLYINYPMIESYQHLMRLPDETYAERKISATLQPGAKYKSLVRKETIIAKYIDFPRKVEGLLREHFSICEEVWRECFEKILDLSEVDDLVEKIETILQGVMEEQQLKTAKYQFADLVSRMGYVNEGKSFWKYMRTIFQQIIVHNICKANKVQNGAYQIEATEYRNCFEELNLTEVLEKQNLFSRDVINGYIWVLNTCVFFVAEYNFALVME